MIMLPWYFSSKNYSQASNRCASFSGLAPLRHTTRYFRAYSWCGNKTGSTVCDEYVTRCGYWSLKEMRVKYQ